jgi:hypothetical protein
MGNTNNSSLSSLQKQSSQNNITQQNVEETDSLNTEETYTLRSVSKDETIPSQVNFSN